MTTNDPSQKNPPATNSPTLLGIPLLSLPFPPLQGSTPQPPFRPPPETQHHQDSWRGPGFISIKSFHCRAFRAAAAVLQQDDGHGIAAVSAAIRVLEDDSITNAGRGSNLTVTVDVKSHEEGVTVGRPWP